MRPPAWTALVAALALALPASATAAPAPVRTIGEPALGPMKGVAIAPNGRVYVVDSEKLRVMVYANDGDFLFGFGKGVGPGDRCEAVCANGEDGAGDGAFALGTGSPGPGGVAIAPGGDVYVADTLNHRVQRFSAEGQFEDSFGQLGAAEGELSQPAGLAVDRDGRVYVADTDNHRIERFSAGGAFERAWGVGVKDGADAFQTCLSGCQAGADSPMAGGLHYPKDVAIYEDGRLAVVEPYNHRISQFTTGGGFVRAFGKNVVPGNAETGFERCTDTTTCQTGTQGDEAGALRLNTAWGLAADRAGFLYLADSFNARIQQFRSNGEFVLAWGQGVRTGAAAYETCTIATTCRAGVPGTGSGSLNNPTDVAARCGQVFAADWGNERIQLFGGASACPARPPAGGPAPAPAPAGKPAAREPALGPLRLTSVRRRRDGTATVRVAVPSAGRVVATDARRRKRRVRRAARSARGPGVVSLRLKPSRLGRRTLRRRGRVRLTARIAFTPEKGDRSAKRLRLTLRQRHR